MTEEEKQVVALVSEMAEEVVLKWSTERPTVTTDIATMAALDVAVRFVKAHDGLTTAQAIVRLKEVLDAMLASEMS